LDPMIPISIVISTKNEELNIQKCISCCNEFMEIIVVDSMSTDSTKTICNELGIPVVDFSWNGAFPKKRNWFLDNYDFKTDWVLFLDADEFLTAEFVLEIKNLFAKDMTFVGFNLRYRNYFMGKPLRFGDRQQKLALFKVKSGRYERIEDRSWTTLDMEVHEHPQLVGKVGTVKSLITHNDFKGLSSFFRKHDEYARWEARRFLLINSDSNRLLSIRQKIKYALVKRWWFSYLYFIYSYFVCMGILDGRSGYEVATCKVFYFNQIRLYIREYSSTDRDHA
jgi:glycosyltransferase involved in cell wall biosynthesis